MSEIARGPLALFLFVHYLVSLGDKVEKGNAVIDIAHDSSYACGDLIGFFDNAVYAFKLCIENIFQSGNIVVAGIFTEDNEFVAAESCANPSALTAVRDDTCEPLKSEVAFFMSVAVVDDLQTVHINK